MGIDLLGQSVPGAAGSQQPNGDTVPVLGFGGTHGEVGLMWREPGSEVVYAEWAGFRKAPIKYTTGGATLAD